MRDVGPPGRSRPEAEDAAQEGATTGWNGAGADGGGDLRCSDASGPISSIAS
jgi:hypothetical protein